MKELDFEFTPDGNKPFCQKPHEKLSVGLALFEPEIPHNTGALMRLCACLDLTLHLIEPLGFILSDKYLKRASMDYRDKASIKLHASFEHFKQNQSENRLVLFDTLGKTSLFDFEFNPGDILLFGKESKGVPASIFETTAHCVSIPLRENCRSLNLALSAAMGLTEAIRQLREKA